MATAELITDNSGRARIAVTTALREKTLIKRVPGAKWDSELTRWTFPKTYSAAYQLSQVFGKQLEPSKELKAFAREKYDYTMTRWHQATAQDADLVHPRAGELSPLQRAGANFLAHDNSIMADDLGAGKTVQAVVGMQERFLPTARILVVCPNAVKRVWERHIGEWTDLAPRVVKGSKPKRDALLEATITEGGVAVMNWESIKGHSRLAPYGNIRLSDKERVSGLLNEIEWDLIIFDEAHRAKDPKSKQTRAGFALKHSMAWSLTGTPIANHPGDYWSLLHLVDPDEWPSRSAYVERYCVLTWNMFGGSDITGINHATEDEFAHLTDRYYIRRLQKDVIGKDIKVVHETRYIELPPRQRRLYDQFKEELLIMIGDDPMAAVNPLAATSRLRQLSQSMMEPNEDGDFRMCEPSPKVDEAMALLDDTDGPVVYFSSSKQLANLIAARCEKDGVPYLIATGDQDYEVRVEACERFQNGEGRALIATHGALAEGVTLTRAKVLCFVMRDWSMVKNKQASDRIRRWGQEADSVTVVDIIAEDTIDERVWEVYGNKLDMLAQITRDKIQELI